MKAEAFNFDTAGFQEVALNWPTDAPLAPPSGMVEYITPQLPAR